MSDMPRERRPRRLARLWVWTKRIALGAVACGVLSGASGLVYQRIATSRDARRFPPPGRLVEVGDRRLHVLIRGEGSPTVVFDSVLGASGLSWALVQPEIAKLTRTVSYDRAGYGWSEPGPRPRDSERIVWELHELLDRSGMRKPYVLVGASLGGCNARLYAFRYPADVAGLVLVDPAHEDQLRRMSPTQGVPLKALRLFQLASRLGLMRLGDLPVDIAGMHVLPAEQQPAADAVGFRTAAVDAITAETAAVAASFDEVRRAREAAGPQPLGDRPLIVLTHREATPPTGDEAAAYATWVQLHAELSEESTRGRHVIVEKSGHFIAADQPAQVIAAIREIVEAVRQPAP